MPAPPGARLNDMPRGTVTSTATQGASAWDVIVGDRFIAALAAPAPDAVLAALAKAACEPAPALEELVGGLPYGEVDPVESFALVWWPGEELSELTAVVRGDGVVDLESPGGSRRFDARDIRPWLLAEFNDVTGLRLTGSDARLEPIRGGEPVPHARASLRVSAVEWTSVMPPPPTTPVKVVSVRPDLDAVFAPLGRPAGDEAPVHDARPPSVEADTILLGRSRVDADTVIVARPRAGTVDGSSAPSRADTDTETTARGSGDSPGSGAPATAAPTIPQVRIAGGPARSVTVPIIIGRRPSPRRIAGVAGPPPELVTVASPGGFISATHVELRIEGTRLVATDLRSTNGTTLRSVGGQLRRLRSGESVVVIPGASLDLGDDTIIEILPPAGVDRTTRPDDRLPT